MISPALTANIFSKLGSNSSLLPIAAKDVSHSVGLTTASYVTGSQVEGKDRFIDEFGTQAIWLGGIPFYKKVIDLTLFKLAKHNANLDVRVLKDKNIMEKAIEHAPTEEIAKSIKKAANSLKTFKGLTLAKFVAATALTLGSYAALTVFRHKSTEKAIIKELQKEEITNKANQEFLKSKTSVSFKAALNAPKKQQNPSFGMNLAAGLKDFMFNPVKNMMIVDGGITAERLKESRNPQDFLGYVIKEGSFWAFMYLAGPKIQQHFEKVAQAKNKKSIDLNIKVLQDKKILSFFKTGKVEKSLEEFNKLKTPEEIYQFICTNKNNLVVKMAKKSGIIKTYKEKNKASGILGMFKKAKETTKVDTQKFIDLKEVDGVAKKLEKLYGQYKVSGENIEQFMKKVVALKKGSIVKNLGTCMGVLGLVVPGVMLAMRYLDKDNKDFQVKKQIKEKMSKQAV